MRFRAKVELIMFQKKQFRKIYLNALENVNERAGQAWIAEAIDNTPIPTWSGASRATFEKLASELGTSVMYGPQRSYKDRRALGRSTSAGSGVVRKMDGNNVYIGFAYETDLRYLAYNEYNRAVPGPEPQPWSNNVRFTPYNFQNRARDAWEEVATKFEPPHPGNYIKKLRLR